MYAKGTYTRIINTLTSNADKAALNFANGVYYWRAYPASEAELKRGGVSGRLAIVYAPAPTAAAPSPPVRTVPQSETPPPMAPPLATPRNLRPAAGYTLTEAIIIRDRQVAFSWDVVPDAAEYTFTLFHVTVDITEIEGTQGQEAGVMFGTN
ncbi:hypothetical protein AGMMS50293_09080 [Spirochaetia bacterium]|nr:hypothetical protein AGMMS50293_09080 [Spirochaetia bacterium]